MKCYVNYFCFREVVGKMSVSDFLDEVTEDELWPAWSRKLYIEELQRQGDSPGLAAFRLTQRMNGLREQWARNRHGEAMANSPSIHA